MRKIACVSEQFDPRICYSLPEQYITFLCYFSNLNTLAISCSCADPSVYYLFGKAKYKLSRDDVHKVQAAESQSVE